MVWQFAKIWGGVFTHCCLRQQLYLLHCKLPCLTQTVCIQPSYSYLMSFLLTCGTIKMYGKGRCFLTQTSYVNFGTQWMAIQECSITPWRTTMTLKIGAYQLACMVMRYQFLVLAKFGAALCFHFLGAPWCKMLWGVRALKSCSIFLVSLKVHHRFRHQCSWNHGMLFQDLGLVFQGHVGRAVAKSWLARGCLQAGDKGMDLWTYLSNFFGLFCLQYIYMCSNITYSNQVQGIKRDYLLQVVTFVHSWLALAT